VRSAAGEPTTVGTMWFQYRDEPLSGRGPCVSGQGLDFVVLDEYASMAPEAWTDVLRPSLSDRQGKALFIGTPRGYNHFYELFERAHHQNPHLGRNLNHGRLHNARLNADSQHNDI
jgi:hypothetical protein